MTQFKIGDRVTSTFFQTWTGGRIPADASKNSLGGQLDGVLAEYVALPQHGAIRIPELSELRGGRDAALRGADRVERAGRDRSHQGGRDGRHPRHRRRRPASPSLFAKMHGAHVLAHLEQRRQARARQGARRGRADQLQVDARLGQGDR